MTAASLELKIKDSMRAALQYVGWSIGLPLELLIISALLRGAYRRFPFLLLYSVTLFLTTVVEISVNQAYFSGIRFAHSPVTYYWIDEAIRQALIFSVVLSLTYLATSNLRSRRLVRTALIAGSVILAVASFLVHYDYQALAGRWMTPWVRDIDFAAALLDLGLWTLLLASRHRDTQVLVLSGALGIQFAGEAIAQSLRHLFQWSLSPGDLVGLTTNLAGLWIMWQALRRPVTLTAPAGAGVALPPRRDKAGVAKTISGE
jgi:hypothetical protein